MHTSYEIAELTGIGAINYDQDPPYLNKYEYDSCDEPIRPQTDRWTSRICPMKVVEKFDVSDIFSDADMSFTTSKKSFKSSTINQTNAKMSFQSNIFNYILITKDFF